MSPLHTNADRDLRMTPVQREQARIDDYHADLIQDGVDRAKRKAQADEKSGTRRVKVLAADTEVPLHLVEDVSQVKDGTVYDRALLEMTHFDPLLPLPTLGNVPGRWWWRGGWELRMSPAMWEAYLSGHWCMKCQHPLPVDFGDCGKCKFSRATAEKAANWLWESTELAWQDMQRKQTVPIVPAGALKGLKPINTRGAA